MSNALPQKKEMKNFFERFDCLAIAEAVALIATTLALISLIGLVGVVNFGFFYELEKPTCPHRARPLRLIALLLGVLSGWGAVPALVWGGLHAARMLSRREAYEEAFIAERVGKPWKLRMDCFLGIPISLTVLEHRDGKLRIDGVGRRDPIKKLEEINTSGAVWGYGTVEVFVRAHAHERKESKDLRVPSPKWVVALIEAELDEREKKKKKKEKKEAKKRVVKIRIVK